MDTALTNATLEDVRLAIFRQHTQLAQLLDEAEACAQAVARGSDGARQLAHALELLHERFVKHLAFEESHLGPLLPRGTELFGDHQTQRAQSEGLFRDRRVFSDPKTVAAEALVFVHTLRRDMAEEDGVLRSLR